MTRKRVMIYKRFERFWHWTQMLLIVTLGLTGFEIHGVYQWLGFDQAIYWHTRAGWGLLILVAFAIFWHLTTGEWQHYVPSNERVSVMLRYYTNGIFKNEPHPYKKTEISKLNPLQRLVYLGFKILIIPVMGVTGLSMLYNEKVGIALASLAWWHTLGAFLLLSFFIVHVYMTTTGETVFSNIKAMIFGWEEVEI